MNICIFMRCRTRPYHMHSCQRNNTTQLRVPRNIMMLSILSPRALACTSRDVKITTRSPTPRNIMLRFRTSIHVHHLPCPSCDRKNLGNITTLSSASTTFPAPRNKPSSSKHHTLQDASPFPPTPSILARHYTIAPTPSATPQSNPAPNRRSCSTHPHNPSKPN